jgi:hypothetical protein
MSDVMFVLLIFWDLIKFEFNVDTAAKGGG